MMAVSLYDDSIPATVRRSECMRLLDLAIAEAKRRGRVWADAKRDYYSAKAEAILRLLDGGMSATAASQVVKGDLAVADWMHAMDVAEVEYQNAREAINVYKLHLRSLESEIEREWEQMRRM